MIETRKLLGRRPEPTPDCRGSGAEFEAISTTGRQDVQCGACDRRFNVRIVRTRNRVALVTPIVKVPRHDARSEQ